MIKYASNIFFSGIVLEVVLDFVLTKNPGNLAVLYHNDKKLDKIPQSIRFRETITAIVSAYLHIGDFISQSINMTVNICSHLSLLYVLLGRQLSR